MIMGLGIRATARRALGFCLIGAFAVSCGSSTAAKDGGGSGGSAGHGATGGTGGARDGGKTDGPGTCPPALVTPGASSGTMSWVDDGTLECAQVIEVTRTIGSTLDTLDINAASTNGTMVTGVDFEVTTTDGTPLTGTYHCNADGHAPGVVIYSGAGVSGSPLDCTITIANPGSSTDVQGTFSLTVPTEGGTKQVTDGTFEIAVSPTGG
jgi:hypothetical protein